MKKKEAKKKNDAVFNNQIKSLTEASQNEMKKLKDESSAELKRRERQTWEIAQKAETLVRKQQEKMAILETEIRLSRDEKRHHQKLCANLIGGVLTDEEVSKLTPHQLELLYREMELALQKLTQLIKKTGNNCFLPKSDLIAPITGPRESTRVRSPLFGSTSPIWEVQSDKGQSVSWVDSNNEKSCSGKDLLPSGLLNWTNFMSTEDLCRLCKSSFIDSILYPCGHSCICSGCVLILLDSRLGANQRLCPLCRLPIESWKELGHVSSTSEPSHNLETV